MQIEAFYALQSFLSNLESKRFFFDSVAVAYKFEETKAEQIICARDFDLLKHQHAICSYQPEAIHWITFPCIWTKLASIEQLLSHQIEQRQNRLLKRYISIKRIIGRWRIATCTTRQRQWFLSLVQMMHLRLLNVMHAFNGYFHEFLIFKRLPMRINVYSPFFCVWCRRKVSLEHCDAHTSIKADQNVHYRRGTAMSMRHFTYVIRELQLKWKAKFNSIKWKRFDFH